uniref:Uncharacterized protein n=1 Tax=Equus asinus TaxID=9793 RepID=A0A9L0KBQ1_EQUAS
HAIDRKCRRGGRELNKPCCLTTCGEVGIREQARARKQTPPASPAPQPAQERPPSSPIYEDAASFKAEPSYRGPVSEPEPVYSTEAAYYQDAHSQQGLAYAPEAVYESTEAQGHYPAGASATPSPSVTISGSGFQVPCSWETVVEAHRIAVLR